MTTASIRSRRNGEPPSKSAIFHARFVIREFRSAIVNDGGLWIAPHITASEGGEIVFEWWLGSRKLTIYCGERNVEYIQVWGIDIDSEMNEGTLAFPGDFRQLWNWLRAA
jgi:hypothetical protein